ncbi:MAG TPA: hypothetical protein VFW49_15040 [Fluviicoccus sp.]|nr:hypothetical protein [Fluviicoccus sp.]
MMLNRDDIIRLAREAGFDSKRDLVLVDTIEITPTLERFAAAAYAAGQAAEREACARMCDDMEKAANEPKWAIWTAEGEVSAAIRARGEKGGV